MPNLVRLQEAPAEYARTALKAGWPQERTVGTVDSSGMNFQ